MTRRAGVSGKNMFIDMYSDMLKLSAFGGLARQKCEHEWHLFGTCVEEIKRIARNFGGISMQGFSTESLHSRYLSL